MEEEEPRARATGRDLLRASVAALHLAAVMVLAIPAPQVSEADLGKRTVIAWFDRVAERIRGVGLPVSSDGLRHGAAAIGRPWLTARGWMLGPARAYASTVGAAQSWEMFAEVADQSARLVIEAERAGEWRPVFLARSDAAAWRRPFFDHARMRTYVNQFTYKRNKAAWDRLVGWTGRALAEDGLQADAWRMGMQGVRLAAPEELASRGPWIDTSVYWQTPLQPPQTSDGEGAP